MPVDDTVRARREATRARHRRRNRLLLAGTVGVAVAIAAGVGIGLLGDGGSGASNAGAAPAPTGDAATTTATAAASGSTAPKPAKHRAKHARARAGSALTAQPAGRLNSPVQDAAGTDLAGTAVLIAGLTASDTSRADIVTIRNGRERVPGQMPIAIHDTAAVALGGAVYVFGGGDGSAQHAEIWRVDAAGGTARQVGSLPAPSSDQAAAAIDGTAYIVGGYTGSTWLDTVVAWRPGGRARVVGHLPQPVRYAAVASAGGRLVIAGGTRPDGSALDDVLAFDPASGAVTRIGRLPAPTTHAAGAGLGDVAYVVGGRGSSPGTPTARILAIDPAKRTVRPAGSLPSPLSDAAAIAQNGAVLVIGGAGAGGATASITRLAPASAARAAGTSADVRFPTDPTNVYAYDGPGALSPAVKGALYRVYVPNSSSNTVDVIDPRTYRVVGHFAVGTLPQHVVPAWNLKRLYVTNDKSNTLTPINPRTGKRGADIPVTDPYNMYFTPNGRFAIVVAEAQARLDFRNPRTFALDHSIQLPCTGPDHMDFSADGTYLLVSCEFSGQVLRVDLTKGLVTGALQLGSRSNMPQDVKLSPDGRVFYVADMRANGVWKVDGRRMRNLGLIRTGRGAHGLYPSRDAKVLYVSNRDEGSISLIGFRTRRVVGKWSLPGGGSPDMGGLSPDGKVLWLSGRADSCVYAISTRDGRLLAKIPVGTGPHGLLVWPQPGRYSLGHTGILR